MKKIIKVLLVLFILIFSVVYLPTTYAATNNISSKKDQDAANKKLIRDYYSILGNKEAYSMKTGTTIDFSAYKKMYKDDRAITEDIENLGNNRYELKVILINDVKVSKELYDVKIEVVQNKIKTISSKQLLHDKKNQIAFGKMKAYIEWDNGSEYVVLEKGDKKYFVDKLKLTKYYKDRMNYLYSGFGNLNFSPKGNFLNYDINGWEGGNGYVYDIQANKIVNANYSAIADGFTNDEKYFYECSSDGMGPGSVKVFFTQPFKLKRDLGKNNIIADCTVDKKHNKLNYVLGPGGKEVVYVYDIYADKILQK